MNVAVNPLVSVSPRPPRVALAGMDQRAASPAEGAQSLAANPSSPADRVLVSIVVPTYREADNLPLLVPRITAALERWSHEIIIVDDNSDDGTDQVVESLRQQGHTLRLIVRTDQRGLSSAVLRGFADAKGEVLICMDADLSHPPETLPHIIQTLERGDVEFVIGSRYVRGGMTDEEWSWFRKLNSKVATLMARPFCQAKDPLAGYFALPRAVFERAEALNPVGYKIGLELLVKCVCTRIAELPIHFHDRRFGQSKLSLREQINYLRHLKRLADFKFGGLVPHLVSHPHSPRSQHLSPVPPLWREQWRAAFTLGARGAEPRKRASP